MDVSLCVYTLDQSDISMYFPLFCFSGGTLTIEGPTKTWQLLVVPESIYF